MELITGFLGVLPYYTSKLENLKGGIGFFSWPELAILVAVISFSYNLIALQKLVKYRGCPAPLANGASMIAAGILASTGAILFESTWIRGNFTTFVILATIQVILSNLICSNLQANLLKKYSPTFMAFAGFLTPLCAAFYGWLLLRRARSCIFITLHPLSWSFLV